MTRVAAWLDRRFTGFVKVVVAGGAIQVEVESTLVDGKNKE